MDVTKPLGRYRFDNIFRRDPATGYLIPNFPISVGGNLYNTGVPILPGLNFGGINLYAFVGKDIAGNWDNTQRVLIFMGFYK